MWRQSSKIPAAQECEKNVDFQGYDQTWEKQVERSGVAALGSDQDSFIGIFPLIILVHKQTFKVFFVFFLAGWSSDLKAFWPCCAVHLRKFRWFPAIKMISKPFSHQTVQITDAAGKTHLAAIFVIDLNSSGNYNCPPNITVIALKVLQPFSTSIIFPRPYHDEMLLIWVERSMWWQGSRVKKMLKRSQPHSSNKYSWSKQVWSRPKAKMIKELGRRRLFLAILPISGEGGATSWDKQ